MDYLKIIKDILTETLDISEELVVEHNYLEQLTGMEFNLNYRDLVYLFFELEKRIGIKIDADNMDEYQFNYINGIIEILNECCSKTI